MFVSDRWIQFVLVIAFLGRLGTGNLIGADAETPLFEFTVVVAKQALLWEGNEVVTWEEIENRIAKQPDPSRCYPHFYTTHSVYGTDREEEAKAEMFRLHSKYNLPGHSEGSLWERMSVRYDRIQTTSDLKPDPTLQRLGKVLNAQGKPVSNAEVILVLVPEEVGYKGYHLEAVQGKARNPLDHILTHSNEQGEFTIHPPLNTPLYVLVMHPYDGFALVTEKQFAEQPSITLLEWATVLVEFSDPKTVEKTDVDAGVPEADGRPDISIDQYWDDLDRAWKETVDPQGTPLGFLCVPPGLDLALSRSFPQGNGSSISTQQAAFQLAPGETRRLQVGPVTKEMRERVNEIRKVLQDR